MLKRGMRRERGVTIIELMIGMVIVSIMLVFAVPSFSTFLQNQQLRAHAQAFAAGLNLARSEALKRNTRVEMILTNDDPVATQVATAVASTTGSNWIVRQVNSTNNYTFIEGREGNTTSGIYNATTTNVSSTASIIGLTNFGVSSLGTTATISLTNTRLGLCAPNGVTRCLNVVVSAGGQVRMCDPDTTLASRDTRKC